jgi:WD40 repeat protein/tRNA A-37 threonylcarbamoyl transferase component Bud32
MTVRNIAELEVGTDSRGDARCVPRTTRMSDSDPHPNVSDTLTLIGMPDSAEGDADVRRFREAWRSAQRPAIEDFLPAGNGEVRREALIRLIRADLQLRIESGEAARVETYLEQYPELKDDPVLVANLAAQEFGLRLPREPALQVHGYLERFKYYPAEVLRRLTGLHNLYPDGVPPTAFPEIAGYELLEKLGAGGMGVVYKARQLSLDRLVALKIIRTERWANIDVAIKRFIREGRAAAQLLDSHIVTIYDAGQAGETHFISMEYVDGITLEKLVSERGPLTVPRACEYARQIALGLQHAHERGMVHRDIKPANLIVTPTPPKLSADSGEIVFQSKLPFRGGTVKILDMGLARLDQCLEPRPGFENGDDSVLTGFGVVMGTPDFMAPEQADDARRADIRADLYSLGCTLYYLLTGRVPFPGGTRDEKRQRHRSEEPVPIVRLRPEVPTGVVSIVHTLMAKRREDRFLTPDELVKALWPFCQTSRVLSVDAVTEADDRAIKPSSGIFRIAKFLPTSSSDVLPLPVGEVDCFEAHEGGVWGVTVSPDGKRALSTGNDGSVRLWDLKLRKELRCLRGHQGAVRCAAFSPDGSLALSGGADRTLRLWNLANGKEVRPFEGNADDVLGVAFLPPTSDGQSGMGWLASIANLSVAYSSEGQLLLSGSRDGTLRLWDQESGLELRRVHGRAEITGVAISLDGMTALTADANNWVRLWAMESTRELCRFGGGSLTFWSLALSPDGRSALSGGEDGCVRLWDLEHGRQLARFDGHEDWVTALAVSPDGRFALSGSDDRTLRLWSLADGSELRRFDGHADSITSVCFSPDGRRAVSGSADGTVRYWQLPTHPMK